MFNLEDPLEVEVKFELFRGCLDCTDSFDCTDCLDCRDWNLRDCCSDCVSGSESDYLLSLLFCIELL